MLGLESPSPKFTTVILAFPLKLRVKPTLKGLIKINTAALALDKYMGLLNRDVGLCYFLPINVCGLHCTCLA